MSYFNTFGPFAKDDYLSHHGIKGQKWGKRNGPPYPLDASTSSRVRMGSYFRGGEKETRLYSSEEWRKRLNEHPIENLKDLKKRDENTSIEQVRHDINNLDGDSHMGRYYNCPNCAAAFELSERGYDVVARPKIGGSNVGNIENFFKGGELKNIDSGCDNKILKDMNDKRLAALSEYKQHRSFDVTGKYKKKYDYEDDKYHDYLNTLYKKVQSNTLNEIKGQGDNSRGIIVVAYDFGQMPKQANGFHAFNYKVENGKVKFFDTQSSSKSEQNGNVNLTFFSEIDPREVHIMRTDTLQVSSEITKAVYSNDRTKRR